MNPYKEWLRENGFSENSIRRYLIVRKQFIEWFEVNNSNLPFNPGNVTAADLQDWKEYLLHMQQKGGKKYAISTINSNLEIIKSYFRFLSETSEISKNPSSHLKKQKTQKNNEPQWLNVRDEATLRYHVDNMEIWKGWQYYRNRAIVYTMLFAGLRISEVSELDTVDIVNGFICIRDGKGGKSRDVYMNKTLAKIMNDWLDIRGEKKFDSLSLFVSQKGGRLTTSGIEKIIDKVRSKSGLKELTPHVLRHTCGHNLIVKGCSLNEVADILGHNDISTTRIYTHSSKEEQIRALETLE